MDAIVLIFDKTRIMKLLLTIVALSILATVAASAAAAKDQRLNFVCIESESV